MKKRTIFFLFVIITTMLLTSCSSGVYTEELTEDQVNHEQKETLETDDVGVEYNSIDFSKYNSDNYIIGILGYSDSAPVSAKYGALTKIYDEDLYKDISPSAEKTIKIGGEEIKGYYDVTYYRLNNYFPCYMYKIPDNGGYFSLDEMGKIGGYINYKNKADNTETLTEDKYISIAKDFVEDALKEEKIDWSLFKTEVQKDREFKGYITVVFDRYLGGMKTTESIYVELTYSGKVSAFSSDMLGRIPADLDLSVFESKNVEASVYKRLDEIYSGLSKETRDKYKIRYYLPEPVLSVLADGTPCFIYDANVGFKPVDNQDGYSDLVRIMVTPTE
ncbi:MAG: hypothetical protein IKC38_01680 [Clostridia bacterium]|nr:hypothetical protein [Clostridia bacterium]